jgi:predicted nucleic acid binding AN1-type Zn finger protein
MSSKRCHHELCKKKLSITDLECKCNKRFCMNHRLPESHNCLSIERERESYKQYLKETLLDAKFEKIEKL